MFKLIKILGGRINVPEPECFPSGGPGTVADQPAVVSGGYLSPCGETIKPTHITIGEENNNKKYGYAITPEMIFEVPINGSPVGLCEGDKVTIESSNGTVTATKTGGVATIVSMNGATKAGDKILVKFE